MREAEQLPPWTRLFLDWSARRPPIDRESEGKLYERLLRKQYEDPDLILDNAGMWSAERVVA